MTEPRCAANRPVCPCSPRHFPHHKSNDGRVDPCLGAECQDRRKRYPWESRYEYERRGENEVTDRRIKDYGGPLLGIMGAGPVTVTLHGSDRRNAHREPEQGLVERILDMAEAVKEAQAGQTQRLNALSPDKIRHDAAEIQRLREALEPFAQMAPAFDGINWLPDRARLGFVPMMERNRPTVGDVRRARAVMERTP